MSRPIGIDLFAGAGGLSLGFEQAGFDVLACVEYDPIHAATHKFNFPNCTTFCKSVTDVTGEELRQQSLIGDREVAVVFGGSPCQGYSMIGKRALDDPRNSLVLDFVRVVSDIRPQYFVFENVPGLAVGQHSKFLKEIIDAFSETGYRLIDPYRVLKAKEFGVPQDRRRLFLIGARADMPLPSYPEPRFHAPTKGKTMTLAGLPVTPTVSEAINDLPDVEDYDALWDSDSVSASFKEPSPYAAPLRESPRASDDYSYRRIYDHGLLTSSNRTAHTELSIRRFSATAPGTVEPVSRFLRLDPNGLCNTLRAGTGAERGAYTSPRPIHPYKPRCITVREAARLHSYPDWFRFHVTKWHGFRQVGNSVPPHLAKAVASEIIRALAYSPKAPEETLGLGDERLLRMDMSEASRYFGLGTATMPRRSREVVRS